MIDLHTHSDASDGSLSPARLVEAAMGLGLEALAIADHDTLSGYDLAREPARDLGLDLVCAIEVGTALADPPLRHVHLLAYFLSAPPAAEFRAWLEAIHNERRRRNALLAGRLQSMGLAVAREEAEALGRSVTGRPHCARVLVKKGYARDVPDAFDRYLGNQAPGYVPRREPSTGEAIGRVLAAGGLPVLAHPARLTRERPEILDALVADLVELGLGGLEVYHSEHAPDDTARLLELAQSYGLAVTGGSDFHGEAKPGVRLGTGMNGNLAVPREVLDRLRGSARQRAIR
jgi:predicted metal-dependent phosphoesterase TrpH